MAKTSEIKAVEKTEETKKPKEHFVKQSDAKVLREAVAWACKRGDPSFQSHLMGALARYAVGVRVYCQHPDRVYVEVEKATACLDCGLRERVDLEVVKK